MRFRFSPALKVLAALAFACGGASLCSGQSRRSDSTQRELQRSLERDLLMRDMEAMASTSPTPQPPRRPSFEQLSEDFERIQLINRTLAQVVASGKELDFKAVGQSVSEIRKRAGRLKENLLLPEGAEDRPKLPDEIGPEQFKPSLTTLNKLVVSFAHNPGFQSVNVVDAHWSTRARSDLEAIIQLSGQLKKSCEQLQKVAQKSR
ncbi:MAG: hypothetical protein JOZ96_04910 [Acidobacteria bacterium]|nr:hypothetical protein [Acidobacteriota bacterium]